MKSSIRSWRAGILLACIAICLTACDDSDVSVDRDQSISIPAGSTWAWANQPVPNNSGANAAPMIENDIVRNRVQNAVATQLAAKGFRQVEDRNQADFLVDYHIGVHNQTTTVSDITPSSPRPVPVIRCKDKHCWESWYWGYWGPPEVNYHTVHYREGSLMIDFVQRSSGRLAWRAISKNPVTQTSFSEENVSKGVATMLAQLGPST
jgi:Domain of unknown function (DUF4136)